MADEDRGSNGRSTSPYHKRCFPPYCDNAAVIDKHAIGKMPRDDLEDRYIVYGDENLAMKKQLRENERQIQRLQTALARQDQLDKKGGRKPASSQYENDRIDALESLNRSLQAKVKVLKQQLMTHSYYHAKEHKLAEGREKRKREMNSSPDFSFRDGQSHSAREARARSYKSDTPRRSNLDPAEAANLREKLAIMEQLLETQREKYKSKIALLEKHLAAAGKPDTPSNEDVSVHSQKLSNNVEMIKLRRQNQEQSKKLANLTEQQETALREIAELQGYVKEANERKDKVQKQLDSEREKLRDTQSQLTKSLSNSETIKVLEEQIRDLQKEKMTLKDTNERLLQLTTGPQARSSNERIAQEAKLKHQISSLEKSLLDKIQDLEEKNEQIAKLEALVKEEKDKTEGSVKSLSICSDCAELKTQLSQATIQNQKLADKLMKAKDIPQVETSSTSTEDLENKEQLLNEELRKQYAFLESRLDLAEAELQELRLTASQHKQCRNTDKKREQLEKSLNEALLDINNLKTELSALLSKLVENKSRMKNIPPDEKSHSSIEAISLTSKSPSKSLGPSDKESSKDSQTSSHEEHDPNADPLTPSLLQVQKLFSDRRASPGPEKYSLRVSSTDSDTKRRHRLTLKDGVTDITNLSQTSPVRSTPSTVQSCRSELRQLRMISTEVRNMSYSEFDPESDDAKDTISNPDKKQLMAYQPQEETLSMFVDQDQPSESEKIFTAEKLESKPLQRTEEVEVSHHQFQQVCFSQDRKPLYTVKKLKSKPLQKTEEFEVSHHQFEKVHFDQDREPLYTVKKLKSKPLQRTEEFEVSHHQFEKVHFDQGRKPLYTAKKLKLKPLQRTEEVEVSHHQFEKVRFYQDREPLYTAKKSKSKPLQRTEEVGISHQLFKKVLFYQDGEPLFSAEKLKSKPLQKTEEFEVSHHQFEKVRFDQDGEPLTDEIFLAEIIEPKSSQKPKTIIVSHHEFDKVLMKKQEYLARTEVYLPVDGKENWNCRLEIGILDLEVDKELLDQLNEVQKDPHVSVVWSFLGLEQKTAAMPANNAQFHTNVSYFGPLSRDMTNFVQKEVIPVWLLLVERDGRDTKVAQGGLDVTPALEQPSRTFLRSVALRHKQRGSATVYVSFKLHDCCETDKAVEVPETIEVGIGRLSLKSPSPKLDATHLYVEYSLLGRFGNELETDSVPTQEVMLFNHRKKHKVTEENSSKLGPLLNPVSPKALRFNVIAEPCNLDSSTEVQEIGFAEVNLLQELVYKKQDMISAPFPVFNEFGETLGSLSLTVIGCSTLQNHTDIRQR